MLPLEIKNKIVKIKNLFHNYEYMKKNQTQLEQLENDINKIIKDLDYYKNKSMIDLTFEHEKLPMTEKAKILDSESSAKTKEFYENCLKVKFKFKTFLDKINARINTLNINKSDFTEEEKNAFYIKIADYIRQNQIDLLEQILNENIIDLNYFPEIDDENGIRQESLIIIACQNNNLNIVKILYINEANLNVDIQYGITDWSTPLLKAISNENYNLELIRFLLDHGASPNVGNLLGPPPLVLAMKDVQLFEEIIVKYNADINFFYDSSSILHDACSERNLACVKILLDHNVNINIRNFNEDTPLHFLIQGLLFKNQLADIKEIIQLFLNRGFDVNLQNVDGDTILHEAAKQWFSLDIIQYLLNNGSVGNISNADGNTALHCLMNSFTNRRLLYAFAEIEPSEEYYHDEIILKDAIKNFTFVIDLFIVNNFAINSQNNLGNTILHQSILRLVNIDIIEYLLNKGALVNIKNNIKKTALEYSRLYRNDEVNNLINKYSKNN